MLIWPARSMLAINSSGHTRHGNMKINHQFRLTDKEIDSASKAIIFAITYGGFNNAALQRVLDKMFKSKWFSNTKMFSTEELKKMADHKL